MAPFFKTPSKEQTRLPKFFHHQWEVMHTLFGTYYYFVLNISHDLISPNNNNSNDESLASYSTALIIVCFMVFSAKKLPTIDDWYWKFVLRKTTFCCSSMWSSSFDCPQWKEQSYLRKHFDHCGWSLVSSSMYHTKYTFYKEDWRHTYLVCDRLYRSPCKKWP